MPPISAGFLNLSGSLLMMLDHDEIIDQNKLFSLLEEDDISVRNSSDEVYELLVNSMWLIRNEHGGFEINNSINLGGYSELRELQLELLWLYIKQWKPPWMQDLSGGPIKARTRISSIDIKQIFEELGLLDDIGNMDRHAKKCWNRIKSLQYAQIHERNNETGIIGEALSVEFERVRTGVLPIQVSVESDFFGYDILSVFSKENKDELRIEVKTSVVSNDYAKLHLTRKEFEVCSRYPESYLFHLWDISGTTPLLLQVETADMIPHCPDDNGEGEWESVAIDYSVFEWDKAEGFG